MVSVRALVHPGWIEVDLGLYSAFEDCWSELELLRGSNNVNAAVFSGSKFAHAAAEVTPEQARRFELFELPTLFAFDGQLDGTGLQIALSCDLRICGPGASLRIPLGSRRALALIGADVSADLFASRGSVDAATALQCGIVSHVVADGSSALSEARRVASVIASRGPAAVRLGKEAIWRGLELPLDHALRFETDLTLLLQTTKDRAEGVSAFLEKRQPNFTGE